MTFRESLLWPLSLFYGAVAALRARAYAREIFRRRRLDGVVISVGNLTVGGTGKTPMVLWIAERLLAEGKSVGIRYPIDRLCLLIQTKWRTYKNRRRLPGWIQPFLTNQPVRLAM